MSKNVMKTKTGSNMSRDSNTCSSR